MAEAVDCQTASSWEFGFGEDEDDSDAVYMSPSGYDNLCLGKVDGDSDNGYLIDCLEDEE